MANCRGSRRNSTSPLVHDLALAHRDLRHLARDVGGERHLVGVGVGVVHGHPAAAVQPEGGGAHGHRGDAARHQHQAQGAAPAPARARRRCREVAGQGGGLGHQATLLVARRAGAAASARLPPGAMGAFPSGVVRAVGGVGDRIVRTGGRGTARIGGGGVGRGGAGGVTRVVGCGGVGGVVRGGAAGGADRDGRARGRTGGRRGVGPSLGAEQVLHVRERLHHRATRLRVQPGGEPGQDLVPVALHLRQHRRRLRAQVHAPDAPVRGVGAALHHAARLQPVDQPGHGDGLDLQPLGELALGQPRLALQPDQDAPLRAGDAVLAGAPVGLRAHQPGHVVQQEQEVVPVVAHARLIISGVMIGKVCFREADRAAGAAARADATGAGSAGAGPGGVGAGTCRVLDAITSAGPRHRSGARTGPRRRRGGARALHAPRGPPVRHRTPRDGARAGAAR